MSSEFLIVAEAVLRRCNKPLTAKMIVDYAIEEGLFSDRICGRTPHQTMKSKLSVDIRRHAEMSKFVRTRPGMFFVRDAISGEQIYSAKRYGRSPDRSDVRVVSPARLDQLKRFQGVEINWKKYSRLLELDEKIEFQPRNLAEETEEWKQVLTYILVTQGEKVLCFKRGNFSRVEDVLRGSLCIGFGGHVTREDFDLLTHGELGILRSAGRELAEELQLPVNDLRRLAEGRGLQIIGILNDDSSAIGRKHIAFILQFEVSRVKAWASPTRGEKSIAQLHWIEPDISPHPIWQFEYWSQLCLRAFLPDLAQSVSAFKLLRPARLRDADVLFVMGTVGSGKTEAAKLIAKQSDRQYVNTGQLVAKLLGVGAVTPDSRERFQRDAQAFIERPDGPGLLAGEIFKIIESCNGRVVVDGIRQRATLDIVRKEISSLYRGALLYVHTTPDMAHKFYCDRKGARISFMEFLRIRDAKVEAEVPHFLRGADGVVYNWFGRRKYSQTVRQLVKRISHHAKS